MARLIPPIRRLLDQRNQLQQQVLDVLAEQRDLQFRLAGLGKERGLLQSELETLRNTGDILRDKSRDDAERVHVNSIAESLSTQLNELSGERNNWRWRAEALDRQVSAEAAQRSAGRVFGFDYDYHPRVRDWTSLPGGNFYASLLEQGDWPLPGLAFAICRPGAELDKDSESGQQKKLNLVGTLAGLLRSTGSASMA